MRSVTFVIAMQITSFQLTALGTNAGSLHKNRYPSAYLLEYGSLSILLDCGEGTQHRMIQRGKKLSRIHAVFISHLHADHYLGLPGLLHSMDMQGRTQDLFIIAPAALQPFLDFQFSLSQDTPRFPLRWILTDTVDANALYPLLSLANIKIEAVRLDHRVPCCGFIFTFSREGVKFNKQKIDPTWSKSEFETLARGEALTVEGKHVVAETFCTSFQFQKSLVYLGDTRFVPPVASLLPPHAVIIHEATYAHELERKAQETGHATAKQAALFATQANASALLITHFSSRYDDLMDLENEAKDVFANSTAMIEGETHHFSIEN
jgi:ribonuclease Z